MIDYLLNFGKSPAQIIWKSSQVNSYRWDISYEMYETLHDKILFFISDKQKFALKELGHNVGYMDTSKRCSNNNN